MYSSVRRLFQIHILIWIFCIFSPFLQRCRKTYWTHAVSRRHPAHKSTSTQFGLDSDSVGYRSHEDQVLCGWPWFHSRFILNSQKIFLQFLQHSFPKDSLEFTIRTRMMRSPQLKRLPSKYYTRIWYLSESKLHRDPLVCKVPSIRAESREEGMSYRVRITQLNLLDTDISPNGLTFLLTVPQWARGTGRIKYAPQSQFYNLVNTWIISSNKKMY